MAVVPSLETGSITTSADTLGDAITERSGLHVKVSVPNSYIAVVEAMAAGRVDVAWFGPLAYVLAHQKAHADALLIAERDGYTNYFGVILARKDGPVHTLKDLKGRKFAFVDPLSTSGTLYPKALLAQNGINPEKDLEPIYAGGHDKAVIALVNRQVDGCACYGGYNSDARDRAEKSVPNVMKQTFIVARTAKIPNDNVAVSEKLPSDVREKLKKALLDIANSADGKKMLMDVADISSLKPTSDAEYDSVREMAKLAGLDIEATVRKDQPKKPAPKKP